ncbi:alpha/beta fold hydrolase [Saccharospirillum impatiens]|uniref:alpha/beta fold hydrolase n=1 Tax=Saccharospirillum impatiens TaxID=169438 RepID=UPI00146EEAAC|nr:alpha/beta hydrolase [Saccharospirillum impatiens]
MQERMILLNDRPQHYCETGPEDAPVIVLLHGISSGAHSWEPLAPHLPGFRLLAWDAPGYGSSAALTTDHPDAANYADRLNDWLDALNINNVLLVGHSLGALIASAFVARHGRLVAGVILADPARGYKHETAEVRDQVYRSRWPALVELGNDAFATERAPRLLRPGPEASALERVQAGMSRLNLDGFKAANWLLANDDLTDWWPVHTALPARVLCGDDDAITRPDSVRALSATLALPYRGIARAGHASYLDAPAAFARELIDVAGIAGLEMEHLT